jgi:uroporphyrinogen decarboxylase
MPTESMTPRERWLAVLNRQTPDRIPMDYWSTPEFSAKLIRHMGLSRKSEKKLIADLNRYSPDPRRMNEGKRALREALVCLSVDFPVSVGPKFVGPKPPENTDIFGCTYRTIQYGTGEYSEVTNSPLAQFNSADEIDENYHWPDPDWWDYSVLSAQIEGWEHHPIRGGGSEPFLTYKSLRGQEQAMMDLVEHPDIVHYCLDKLFELAYINSQRIYETLPGKVMISYVAEDMGGQDTLMFSRKHIRTYLLPRMKRIIDLAHQAGAYVFHHNDGNCRAILPDMIELGIDVLNPIQWRCKGMEREGLKADFGEKIVFHGAVDNQYTLPFGTLEEVRQEVRDDIRILGEGGGYILAPCHNIQPVSNPESIIAMYEEARNCG